MSDLNGMSYLLKEKLAAFPAHSTMQRAVVGSQGTEEETVWIK